MSSLVSDVEALLGRLRTVSWKERDGVKEELLAYAQGSEPLKVRDYLESKAKSFGLELRWEVEEIIEKLTPKADPEPEPEPEPEEKPGDAIDPKELKLAYDDPRGIRIHTTKSGKRWFLTQPNPYTRQFETIELSSAEITKVKAQLLGSPYWTPDAKK
jgi:hypothetical protein